MFVVLGEDADLRDLRGLRVYGLVWMIVGGPLAWSIPLTRLYNGNLSHSTSCVTRGASEMSAAG